MVEENVIIRKVHYRLHRNAFRDGKRIERPKFMRPVQTEWFAALLRDPDSEVVFSATMLFAHPVGGEHEVRSECLDEECVYRVSLFLSGKVHQCRD